MTEELKIVCISLHFIDFERFCIDFQSFVFVFCDWKLVLVYAYEDLENKLINWSTIQDFQWQFDLSAFYDL